MRRPPVVLPFVAALIFLTLAVAAAVNRTSAENDTPAANHPLVGAWLVDQNVDDTTDPPALSIFMAEGTAYEANPAVGDGVGVWRATGERTAAATFVFQVVGEDGSIQATVKARADLEVDASGDAFTSVYAFAGIAPDGTVAFSGEATGRGTRLVVEPRLPSATPAAAGVMTSETLLETTFAAGTLPPGLTSVELIRYGIAPGTTLAFPPGFVTPHAELGYVVEGRYAIRAAAPLTVFRASAPDPPEMVPAGTEVVLGPGDAFVIPDVPVETLGKEALGELGNPGPEPLEVIGMAVWSDPPVMAPAGMDLAWYTYLDPPVDARDRLAAGPTTLTLDRVTLAPGAALPLPGAGAVRLVVEEGSGVTRSDPIRNGGDEPLVLLVMTIVPADANAG